VFFHTMIAFDCGNGDRRGIVVPRDDMQFAPMIVDGGT
jgi:hypothetical protein